MTSREKTEDNDYTNKNSYPLSLYPGKTFSAIASGATPIGSAERAPDKKQRSSNEDKEAMTQYESPSFRQQ
jgi:hypothetical protein